jgi:hypothetical protein
LSADGDDDLVSVRHEFDRLFGAYQRGLLSQTAARCNSPRLLVTKYAQLLATTHTLLGVSGIVQMNRRLPNIARFLAACASGGDGAPEQSELYPGASRCTSDSRRKRAGHCSRSVGAAGDSLDSPRHAEQVLQHGMRPGVLRGAIANHVVRNLTVNSLTRWLSMQPLVDVASAPCSCRSALHQLC